MAAAPFDLAGKVAIVTGGNGGIGLGMARGLAEAGAAVAIVGRNQAKCPQCHSQKLSPQLSVFAMSAKSGSSVPASAGACGSCGDPRGAGACSLGDLD